MSLYIRVLILFLAPHNAHRNVMVLDASVHELHFKVNWHRHQVNSLKSYGCLTYRLTHFYRCYSIINGFRSGYPVFVIPVEDHARLFLHCANEIESARVFKNTRADSISFAQWRKSRAWSSTGITNTG